MVLDGKAITDGTQLIVSGKIEKSAYPDLGSGEVRRVNLPSDQIDSLQLSFNSEGHLLAAGIDNKRFKLWDLTAKKDRELDQRAKNFPGQIQPRRQAGRAFR